VTAAALSWDVRERGRLHSKCWERRTSLWSISQCQKEAWKLPLRATVRQEVHREDKWRWEVKWGQTGWSRHCMRSRAGSCHPSRVQGGALGRRNSKEKRPRYQTRVSIIVPVHK
jgi:hypothetical protein